MLLTRLLPPQFLLPAWSSKQLAQAAQRAHRSDYTTATEEPQNNSNDNLARRLQRRGKYAERSGIFKRLKVNQVEDSTTNHDGTKNEKPQHADRLHSDARRDYNGNRPSKRPAKLQADEKKAWDEFHGSRPAEQTTWPGSRSLMKQPTKPSGYQKHDTSMDTVKDPQLAEQLQMFNRRGIYKMEIKQELSKLARKAKSDSGEYVEAQDWDSELDEEPLSLFEELFPEEALARQKREKTARDKLDKLPAFNWAMDTVREKSQEQRRQYIKEKRTAIPAVKKNIDTETQGPAARRLGLSKSEREHGQHERYQDSRRSLSRASVLVLRACSKTLEESDFYRIGPKGNHLESWTSGILKVIPARDNITLEPLGQYYLLFSSIAAARLYLDRTLRLVQVVKSYDYLLLKPDIRSRLKEGEDLESMKRNFTLIPTGGILSLRYLEPPHSRGLQWMIEAGGPAPLVSRQEKAQNIILLSTDRGHVQHHDLYTAIMDDGKRRNLHWKLAGGYDEAIVKLETKEKYARADERSTYTGPARYTISFRDSNEARRFVRDWHRRPFPSKRAPQPGDDDPPIINAEILW